MSKYKIMEYKTARYQYEVEAETREQAIEQIQEGEIEPLYSDGDIIDINYDTVEYID